MPPKTIEETIEFLLLVIRHSDTTPDWHKVATAAGIPKPMNAQRRFKAILEGGGRFKLVGKTISDVAPPAASSSAASAPASAPAPAVAPKAKKAAPKPSAKKRKIAEVEEEDGEDNNEEVVAAAAEDEEEEI